MLTSDHITILFLSLGVLLFTARGLGELAQRFHQPAVLGELIAGVLLGPTVLGALAPDLSLFLFPLNGLNAIALDTIGSLAIALFLLVAGMEVDLSIIWKQGKVGAKVGMAGMVIPFFIALTAALIIPGALGRHSGVDPILFALFFAIAISISALPVIARILMDMGLYRTDLGMVVISAAILNDIIGWIVFAIVLSLIGNPAGSSQPIVLTIALTLGFTGLMLTLGRRLIHNAMPFVQAYTRWPAGELSFALCLGLLGAAFTEWIGIHAIFGAFIVGVAVGDSSHLRERTRVIIGDFVSFIFAPVFFAGIGLKVNFLAHFNLPLVLTVLGIAFFCKLLGGFMGARWGGMSSQESWTVGSAMISVGTMGIIVGMIALQAGIIREPLFVALIVMAIVTSMASGPLMRLILKTEKKQRLRDLLSSKYWIWELKGLSRREVIQEMTALASGPEGLDAKTLETAVWTRERILSTGIGNGVALPHARIENLRAPLVVAGISQTGIDFDAPDGRPATVIFLVLTPENDPGAQLEIAAEIARLFRDPHILDQILRMKTFTEFLALIRARVH
jgi:Kef-type K+ transport system membrane component KefB/mannitol/fructose-specific phosphotransferase system IIA component